MRGPPIWTIFPFAIYLLSIATLPLFVPRFWEHNRNKLLVGLVASLPTLGYLLLGNDEGLRWLLHSGIEYLAFMGLLSSLFVVTGGIHLRGSFSGTPLVNTAFLAVGAVLANLIGTTGASMLLLRPLLRANEQRQRKAHIFVLFIFVVSNGAGLLTPLGDPPLFLGFLRGVPFFWTMRLLAPWALVNGALLVIFNLLDQKILNREERERPGSQLEEVQRIREPLRIDGRRNIVLLLAIIGVVLFGNSPHATGTRGTQGTLLRVAAMMVIAAVSLRSTPSAVHEKNRFSWAPIFEVAAVFAAIFITMIPALHFVAANGSSLGLSAPWQLFWASGLLSSVLDNAPTYLTFAALSVGVVNETARTALTAENLGTLAAHSGGALLLTAVSCGSVFMGANTYIGNGPNFMVKAIAEEAGVRMPSFFGYMKWSGAILIPLFALTSLIFFR